MIVYLTGFMGCGKSSVGLVAAGMAGYGFMDTDRMVERMAGKSIDAIFAEEGESLFRELETEALRMAAGFADTVVATGGGAPCSATNIGIMQDSGKVVYLHASPELLLENLLISGSRNRPKIAGLDRDGLREYIGVALAGRESFYRSADYIVECDGRGDGEIAAEILRCTGLAACHAER